MLSKTSNSHSVPASSETLHPFLPWAPRTRDLAHHSFETSQVVSTHPRNTPQSSSRLTSFAFSNTPDTPARKSATPRPLYSFSTGSSTETFGVKAVLTPRFHNLSALTLRFPEFLGTSTRKSSCLPAKTASVPLLVELHHPLHSYPPSLRPHSYLHFLP